MPLNTSSRCEGVSSLDDKVARLTTFIGKDIETRTGMDAAVAPTCYRLIVRSIESPVAQALLSLAPQLVAAGITIRAVFGEADSASASVAAIGAQIAFPGECRAIRDARLLAAHEQLVLGHDCAWVGDSMRREPAKRDAYERYSSGCVQTAALANRSFERLWEAAEPIDTALSVAAGILAAQTPDITGTCGAASQTPPRR